MVTGIVVAIIEIMRDSQRRDRILRFFSTLESEMFSTFGAISLLNYTETSLERKEKFTGEDSKQNPVETVPRNCRFLSLVVVECVLTYDFSSGQKGSLRRGSGKNWTGFFSGFFPWQVREWYVPGPSRHHQIPNFLRTPTFSNRFFPGFNRVFFRVLTRFFFPVFFLTWKKPGSTMADPLWRSPINECS